MTDPLNRQLRAISSAVSAERAPSEAGENILSRLNTLTARQKVVLGLLAEGLPTRSLRIDWASARRRSRRMWERFCAS
jgi:FixJ family two-component response regulator